MVKHAPLLNGIRVVNFGIGMAPALIAKFLAELGATVTLAPPPGGDPFARLYPAYAIWNSHANQDEQAAATPDKQRAIVAPADICIIGGEDYPGVARLTIADALAAENPRLIVLEIEAYPAGTAHAGRPGVDVLVQARSGIGYEHHSDRPILFGFEPSQYGAVFRGLAGLLAALYEREGSGKGQVVRTSLYEGALTWLVSLWCDVDKPNGNTRFIMPKDPYPLIFRCSDGVYIHLVIGAAGSKYRMYQALEIDDPSVLPNDSGMPKPTEDPKNFFGDIDLLAAHVAKKTSAELLERMWALGLPAEPVLPPGACWSMEQIVHNGNIETTASGVRHVGHPIASRTTESRGVGRVTTGSKPLSGIRVVDFGAFVAGPFASLVMADLGAEVIKVEPPPGDPNRSIFRSWTATARGKKTMTIDLKHPEGLAVAKALCVTADVVMNNFRTGVSARLGIDPVSLHAQAPDLIVLESPAYGASGPLADRAGFDMVMQALCGHELRSGGIDSEPLWNRTSMVDYTGGFLGALGVLSALYHRARTGAGVTVENALINGAIFLFSELIQKPDGGFEGAETLNTLRTGYRVSEAMYQTRDGWIAVAARGAGAGRALKSVLGLDGLAEEPSLWAEADGTAIADAIRDRSTDEVVAALEMAGVWVEICVRDVELQVLRDAAMRPLNIVRAAEHPQFGEVRELGGMLRFSRSAVGSEGYAPLLHENTSAILQAIGLLPAEIERLMALKAVV